MSGIAQDIKTGIKGVRGAGDALRGGLMEATDEVFDNNQRHPTTQQSELENKTISAKGKADMKGVDNMLARHEQHHEAAKDQAAIDRHGTAAARSGAGVGGQAGTAGAAAPTNPQGFGNTGNGLGGL